MTDENYNLKKSTSVVGQLYPALLDAEGKVIDGLHRLEDDKDWKVETLEHIDTPYKYYCARLVANKIRRGAGADEIARYVNEMAGILVDEGFRPPEIGKKITQDVGWKNLETCLRYLEDEYKTVTKPKGSKKIDSESISKPFTLTDAKAELGDEKVEKLKNQIKEQLRKDPVFAEEIIKAAPVIFVEQEEGAVSHGFYKPVLSKRQAEEYRKNIIATDESIREITGRPEVVTRKKFIESLKALYVIDGLSHNVVLPDCNEVPVFLNYNGKPITIKEGIELVKGGLDE